MAAHLFSSITASIPEGRFEPYHVIVVQKIERSTRVALRWSYCGAHSGAGRYSAASGLPLGILGIGYFELHDGQIANEWMVIDETTIYAQIAALQAV